MKYTKHGDFDKKLEFHVVYETLHLNTISDYDVEYTYNK